MSWHFSRALVAEYSAANCLDGELFAQSSSTPTPDQYYWPDKTTEHSRLSRFGMTCVLLTGSHGADLLTWFLAGFPARTSAQLVRAPDWRESAAACGVNLQGSFARYDPEASLWRTAQCSLVEGLDEYLETWPRWGSMRDGASYLLPIPAHLTSESESGLWPTPNCIGYRSDGELLLLSRKLGTREEFLRMSSHAANSKRERAWPTPCASASKGSSKASLTRKTGASRESDRLDHAVMASDNGQLNPDWVEWLMGWPIGQTALKPLETAKSQEWLQQHGSF